jgi:hypothetical protein
MSCTIDAICAVRSIQTYKVHTLTSVQVGIWNTFAPLPVTPALPAIHDTVTCQGGSGVNDASTSRSEARFSDLPYSRAKPRLHTVHDRCKYQVTDKGCFFHDVCCWTKHLLADWWLKHCRQVGAPYDRQAPSTPRDACWPTHSSKMRQLDAFCRRCVCDITFTTESLINSDDCFATLVCCYTRHNYTCTSHQTARRQFAENSTWIQNNIAVDCSGTSEWANKHLIKTKEVRWRQKVTYIMRRFIICTAHQTGWTGHVARRKNRPGAYTVLVWKHDGNRPLGRHWRRCVDNIKTDIQEREWRAWNGHIWPRMGTSDGLLRTR